MPRGQVIVVPMVTGQRVPLATVPTTLAGVVRIRSTTSAGRSIAFGDQANDIDVLFDGDAVVMQHPNGVDLTTWYGAGTTGDFLKVIHGGGF
jgi:hypothetical protein